VPAPLVQATGKRKEAVARVRFREGSGKIVVNERPYEAYFQSVAQRALVVAPLKVTETVGQYDIDATLTGGGISGQAGALALGIARGLVALRPELRPVLKKAGMLTRDAREKERKKYGLKKARKAPQYTKR
jgi:small subunit ribosomal protein S9